MKYLLEQPIYSLYNTNNNQERIEFFQKNQFTDVKDSASSIEAFQSVLSHTFLANGPRPSLANNTYLTKEPENLSTNYLISSIHEKRVDYVCSSLSKRGETSSLSIYPAMSQTTGTSLSEEQTNSLDYENTYFYSEDTSRLDETSSLTTITTNLSKQCHTKQQDTSLYSDITLSNSDTEDISEAIIPYLNRSNHTDRNYDLQNSLIQSTDEESISPYLNLIPSEYTFTGLVHATKCTIITEQANDDEQTRSDYDNVNYSSGQNNRIRSSADIVSLNSSMTSSMQDEHCPMPFNDELLNKQDKERTIEDEPDDDDDDYIIVDQQKSTDHSPIMNKESENEMEEDDDLDDEQFESTRLLDNGRHDGMLSDESQYSDDLRYSSDVIQHSCINDDLNDTSSTLRQEAISLTKVRCKQRQTWMHSSTNLNKSFLANNQVDGTDALSSSCRNANMNPTTRVQPTATMLLHKNSTDRNKKDNKDGETLSYDFFQLAHSHHSKETDESIIMSPLSKTNGTHNKEASSSSKKTNNFYLIHHQSSLVPTKDLLDKNLNSNIEIIQMDEQECLLEIVDGVLTLVPKDQSTSSTTNSEKEQSEEQQQKPIDYRTSQTADSPHREERSSSVSSSISTPPLSEHEPEEEEEEERVHEDLSSASSSSPLSSNKQETPEPFILLRDIQSKSPHLPSQTEQSVDLLDLFSTPPVARSSSNTNNNDRNTKNLLDDSLSSVSSYENPDNNINSSSSDSSEREKVRSSSPKPDQLKSSSSLPPVTDDTPPKSPLNKTSAVTELVPTVEELSSVDQAQVDYPVPKSEPPPAAKPINKARINEFASLLSASVHLVQPPPPLAIKKQDTPKSTSVTTRPPPSPSRSEDQSFSSIASANSDRDERESYHTVQSTNNSEQDQTKKHIDARYNEKIDDRKLIQINSSNIKALFEQKISDTNKALAQSNEHLLHLSEARQQHRKVPVSYGSVKRNLPVQSPQTTPVTDRRQSFQDSANMNKYTDHIVGAKDVVIEDKQSEQPRPTQLYGNARRNNTEQLIRPDANSLTTSPVPIANGYYSESLIAREIRETKEKEEELRRQRKKCGLAEDVSALLLSTNNDSVKTDASSSSTKPPVKSTSFLSNLDFFTSKANSPSNDPPPPSSSTSSSRRSTIAIQNLVYDSQGTSSSNDERKQRNSVVSQELNRFNDNGIPIIRTSSTNNMIQRSASNQNILGTQNTTNIIQREIEAMRSKEAELRQLGRIQHTSDEHSDPRKYQEFVSAIPKSQSANSFPNGRGRRDSERINGPMAATSNGFLKPKPPTNNSAVSSVRGKFPSPNPTAPIISSSNKSIDYSKLSSTDRLELEKRECQEREQELRKQRHSVTNIVSPVNPAVNGDSGNVSQDEHDDDQERYFDKIERLKRTENEKAQTPFIRPTKRLELSQKWEQMMANKTAQNTTGDDN